VIIDNGKYANTSMKILTKKSLIVIIAISIIFTVIDISYSLVLVLYYIIKVPMYIILFQNDFSH